MLNPLATSLLTLTVGLNLSLSPALAQESWSISHSAQWGAETPDAPEAPSEEPPERDEFDELFEALFEMDEAPFGLHFFGSVGYQGLELDSINQALASRGYSAFAENALAFGGGFQFIVNGFLTEFEGTGSLNSFINNDTYWGSLTAGTAMLNFGYQFRPVRNLSIYPLVGLGMSFVDLSFNQRNLQPSFDEFLDDPGRLGSAGHVNFALNLGLGMDWSWGWFGLIGLRGGYVFNPFATNFWVLNTNLDDDDDNNGIPISNAPNVQLNGPYVRLILGF